MHCVLIFVKDSLTEVRRKLLNYDFNGMKIIMVTFEGSLQQTNMCMKHYPSLLNHRSHLILNEQKTNIRLDLL